MTTFAGWLLTFFLGFCSQTLILHKDIGSGLLLYSLTGTLAAFLFYYRQENQQTQSSSAHPSSPILFRQHSLAGIAFPIVWIVLASLILFLSWKSGSTGWVGKAYQSYTLYAWLLFIVFILIAAFLTHWDAIKSISKQDMYILGGLVWVAFLLGIYQLTHIPVTVHGDEGMVGLYARKILQGNFTTFFSTSWYALPQLFFFLPSCGLYLFGDNLFGLRMSTVVMGTLCVIPFYLLCLSWWGRKAAVFAGILLISNHWFIHLMHCGVNYVQVTLFTIVVLALWHYCNKYRTSSLLSLAGVVLGLSLMSYQANHLLPILWILSQAWIFLLRDISWKWLLASISIPLLTAALILAPLVIHDVSKSGFTEIFSSRSQGIVVWNPLNYQHLNGSYRAKGDNSLIARKQVERALLSTILYPDTSIQYNSSKPFLDRWASVLFMIGVILAGYRFFEIRWSIPVIWICAILICGGAMTIDAPFFPRLAGSCTLLFFPIAGVIFNLYKGKNSLSYLATTIFTTGLVVLISGINIHYYFETYAKDISTKSVHYAQTKMAMEIAKRDKNEYIYVFRGPHFAFKSGTVLFLAKGYRGEDCKRMPSAWRSPAVIFVDPSRSDVVTELQDRFPSYTVHPIKSEDQRVLFIMLTPS